MTTEQYPLDVKQLTKGQTIEAHEVSRMLGVKLDDVNAYRIAMLQLRGWIEQTTAELGIHLHLQCRRDDLYVLTDIEDVDYQDRQHHNGMRKMGRSFKKTLEIDIAALPPKVERKLIDNQRKQAWRIAALRGAVRKALNAAPAEIEG